MKQVYRFLFVMDPLETLNLETETSLLLMEELLARGHEVLWAELSDLVLRQDTLHASTKSLRNISPVEFDAVEEICVDDVDALLVRPDPPFDSVYLHLTYLLDFVSGDVLQLNPGSALRNYNEKLSTLRFADLAPPTLTTMNLDALLTFLDEHGEIVIKPLDECSGRGIERLVSDAPDVASRIEALLKGLGGEARFITAQKFLKAVAAGDKRIYLAGGEPVGLVNRIPATGGWLGNIHQGAVCTPTLLAPAEHAAIDRIRPFLLENGIFLAGLDFIGGHLTEINITSPSAIRQINAVTGEEVHKKIIDLILERLDSHVAREPASSEARSARASG